MTAIIQSRWFGFHPDGRTDAEYWLAVLAWLADRALPQTDENVKQAIEEMEQ